MSKTKGLAPTIHTARQGGASRKPGSVYGEITREPQIEIDGLTYPINSAKSGCHVDWLKRLVRHTVAKVDEFGRCLVVRVDLHQGEYSEDNAGVTRFLDALGKQIQRKHGHKMGYAWAREQEAAKAQHYHLFLLLDAGQVAWGKGITDMVAKVWGKMGGTVGYCRDPYRVVGRGGVPLQEATHWLSYLTKPRGKGYRADYAHDFSTGRETIKPRPRRKAKIISIAGGWMPWQGRRIKGGTMTVGAFRAMRLGAVAADSWGEVGGLKAVAKILGIDPSTVRAYVKAARPGELENANAQRARKQAADRAKGLAMLRAGATHQEVADALGVSPVTPWNWAGSAPDLAAAAQEQRDARQALEDQARARLLAGESSAALVKELGLNRKVLVRLNRELGLSRKAAPPASPELIAEALAMRAAGSTVRTVGKALGIDPATVSKWAKAASQTVPVIGKADQEGGAA